MIREFCNEHVGDGSEGHLRPWLSFPPDFRHDILTLIQVLVNLHFCQEIRRGWALVSVNHLSSNSA